MSTWKRLTRKPGYEGRDTRRKMVLRRLRKPSRRSGVELARVAGVQVRTVQAWRKKAQAAVESSLTGRRRGRPPVACRKLAMVQEVRDRPRIVGAVPAQWSWPFALWTQRAMQALVTARFGVDVSDRPIGKYLKRWGCTARRPAWRAMEQRPVLIQAWLLETYPAIDNRGEIRFQIVEGTLNTERFIEFLARLIQVAASRIFRIVDNLRVHYAKPVQQWATPRQDKIELFCWPLCAPESSPDEYPNHDFKTSLRLEPASRNDEGFPQKARRIMNRIAQCPERSRSSILMPPMPLGELL